MQKAQSVLGMVLRVLGDLGRVVLSVAEDLFRVCEGGSGGRLSGEAVTTGQHRAVTAS